MLHKINLPECTQHLDWVVQFQSDLLHALCDEHVAPANVTVDWVKAQCPEVDGDWMTRFCSWSKKGSSMLNRMGVVAGLPDADKQALITLYESNIRYPEAFDIAVPNPPATRPLPVGLPEAAVSAYRGFFEMFYAPIFYRDKGYPIEDDELGEQFFHKDNYLSKYHSANPGVKVCPLCDGGMDGAELDHWLAKKYLPELNCHPQNLVEICGACNGRSNKGERLALDEGSPEPFNAWFHPFLRPAIGEFDIERDGDRVKLVSGDPDGQAKLDNFGRIINLGTRWSNEWRTQVDCIQSKIRNHARRGEALDEDLLKDKIQSWKDDADAEVGLAAYAILEHCLLTSALEEESGIFQEFVEYAAKQG